MTDQKKGECCHPPPPSDQATQGKIESWNGVGVYVNCPPSPKSAIVLVTDIFGWGVPQVRDIADFFAGHGYLSVIPNILHNDPFSSGDFPSWLARHSPEGEVPAVKKVIDFISSNLGISDIALGSFCWGAKVAILVANDVKNLRGVIFWHPSFVTVDDIKASNTPLAIMGAEIDQISPPPLVTEFKSILDSNPNVGPGKSFLKIFPGTQHGFGVRYDPKDQTALNTAKQSHSDALAFLKSIS